MYPSPWLDCLGRGEQVTDQGFVDDDLVLELYATRIIGQDGDVVTISPEGG